MNNGDEDTPAPSVDCKDKEKAAALGNIALILTELRTGVLDLKREVCAQGMTTEASRHAYEKFGEFADALKENAEVFRP